MYKNIRNKFFRQCRRGAALVLSAAMLLFLQGCGNQSANQQEREQQTSDMTYRKEKTTLQLAGNEMLFSNVLEEQALYCLIQNKNTSRIRYYDLEKQTEEDVTLELTEGYSAYDFARTGDGYVCFTYGPENACQVVYCDEEGKAKKSIDVSELLSDVEIYLSVTDMCMDSRSSLYLLLEDRVYLFDAEGVSKGVITLEGQGRGLLADENGGVMITYYTRNSKGEDCTELAEIDAQKGKVSKSICVYPGDNYFANINGEVSYAFDRDGFYEMDLSKGKREILGTWKDINITEGNVVDLYFSETGEKLLTYNYERNALQVVNLTKVKRSELPEKKEIIVAALTDRIAEEIANFNEENEEVHVTLKAYYPTNEVTEKDYTQEKNKFYVDMTTGKNEADIFWMEDSNIDVLTGYGIFEDLTPYFEKSKKVKKEDFLDNVVDRFTIDGTLVGIPNRCFIYTLFARASELGGKKRWTVEEMIDYALKTPDIPIMALADNNQLVSACVGINGGQFVDWEQGICFFNQQRFKEILMLSNSRIYNNIKWENSSGGLISRHQALTVSAMFADFDYMQECRSMFDEDVVAIGYPARKGESGTYLLCNGLYAMNTKSAKKEAAWTFIETILSEADERGFPTHKKFFEGFARRELGNEVIYERHGKNCVYGDWSYPIRTIDEKDVSMIRDMLVNGTVVLLTDSSGTEIKKIISEEAAAYFNGQKSLDEVCDIIQSRVSIYVKEQM